MLSRRVCFLNQLSVEVVGFERIKEEHESCPDFGEIIYALKEGVTPEIYGLLLQDDYLFRFRKLCSPYFLERLSCLEIACWRSCWSLWSKKDHIDGRVYFTGLALRKALQG